MIIFTFYITGYMLYQKEEGVVTTKECGKLKKINEPILEATKKTTIFAPLHPCTLAPLHTKPT
jgi:hypothetical protein